MSINNPYFYGPMVTDPAMFFGRKDELARIRDRLRKGVSTAVIGSRRIGKSSLLYQLAQQTDALPEGVLAVYLDLQDAAHHKPLGLLTAALQGLDQRAGSRYGFGAVGSLADTALSDHAPSSAKPSARPSTCFKACSTAPFGES